jgi:SNF2 family DNA or RNA helicase
MSDEELAGLFPETDFFPGQKKQPASAQSRQTELTFSSPRAYQPSQSAAADIALMRFSTTPMRHQTFGVVELIDNPYWLLAWDMGTGKTATMAYRLAIGLANNSFRGPILIVSPLSVVNVWCDQLIEHTGLKSTYLVGSDGPKKRQDKIAALKLKLKDDPRQIIVCNFETCVSERNALVKMGFDAVIVDEVHRIKNSTTKANKSIISIAWKSRFRWAMSGTPAPNGPLDIFGTMLFLNEKIIGTRSRKVFEHRHAIYGAEVAPHVRKIVAYKDLDKLERQIADYTSRVKKTEVLDLPEKLFLNVPVELPPKVRRTYEQLRREAITVLESARGAGTLTLANVLAQSLRLLQITGGYPCDDDGTVHPFAENVKLNTLVAYQMK